MRTPASTAIAVALITFGGCERYHQTSTGVDQSRDRGLLEAEYVLPDDAELGEYHVIEVWVETEANSGTEQLIVRLNGPHHGTEPRVQIVEPRNAKYVTVWSERNGPPYEVWAAPAPLPDALKLQGGGKTIELTRRRDEAQQ